MGFGVKEVQNFSLKSLILFGDFGFLGRVKKDDNPKNKSLSGLSFYITVRETGHFEEILLMIIGF